MSQDIRTLLVDSIQKNAAGELLLDAALSRACGLDPALVAPFSGTSLRLKAPTLGELQANGFTLEGDADLPGAGSLHLRGAVDLTGDQPRLSMRAALGDGWSFRQAFPALPGYTDFGGGLPMSRESFFYALGVTEPAVVVSSYAYDDEHYGPMAPGLNLAARVDFGGPLAFLKDWGITADKGLLMGMLDLSGEQPALSCSLKLPLALQAGPFTLGDIYLDLFSRRAKDGAVDSGMALDLALKLGELSVQLGSRLDIGLSRFTLDGRFKGLTLKNLTGLVSELGVPSLADVLPPGVTELQLPELKRCRVAFDARQRSVESVGFWLQSPAPWKILDGVSVSSVDFNLQIEKPLGSAEERRVEAGIFTRFQLFEDTRLYLRGMYPGFTISGGLEEGSALELTRLLQHPAFHLQGFTVPGNPRIAELGFTVQPQSGHFGFHLELDGDWALPLTLPDGKGFALQRVVLDFTRAETTSARLAGTLDVAGTPLLLSAELPHGGGGVLLEGGTAPGAALDLTQLGSSLLASAGLTLPPNAPDISFSGVSLRVDTRAETRSLVLEGSTAISAPIPVGEGKVPLELSLAMKDVAYDFTARRFSGRFDGRVAFDEVEFTTELIIGEGQREVSFQQGDQPLELQRLIRRFLPEDVGLPPELPGLEGLTISGIGGGFDLAQKSFHFQGTAAVTKLTAGALVISNASGSLELSGKAGALEQLTVKLSASVGQELVPELSVDRVDFVLELKKPEGEGWKWHVGGGLEVRLPGLPKQTLKADGTHASFTFSLVSTPALTWSLPGVVEGSFSRVALALARDEKTRAFGWSLEARGGLKVASLPRLSGTLGLYGEEGKKGLAFTADKGQEPLKLTLPLVPGVERLSVGGSLKLESFSLLKKGSDWELGLTNELALQVPRPSSEASQDPIDQALRLLEGFFARPATATLTATSKSVGLSVTGLPRLEVPFPVLVGGQLVWDRKVRVALTELALTLGSELTASGTLALTMPEELNNLFGEENGRPKVKLLSRELAVALAVDTRLSGGSAPGLSVRLASSPFDLAAAGCFKDEVEPLQGGGQRKWTRFTLGDLTFRFGGVPDPGDAAKQWWHVDFGELGEVRFLEPRFSFNGSDFIGSGGFDIVRDVRLPTRPLRWVMDRAGLSELAKAMPEYVAPLDIHVLEKGDGVEGGKRLNAGAFMDKLQELSRLLKLNLPLENLRPVVTQLASGFNQLPASFSDYLDFSVPKQLEFSLAVTPGTGFGLKFDVRAPKDPLRILVPTGAGFTGLTLRKLSLGEALSGNLLIADMDVEVDSFDFVSLAAALLLPATLTGTFTHTQAIQRKAILKDVLWLIIWQTQVPIPIPVYFDQVGYRYYGLEGLQSQFILCNNITDLSLTRLLKGLVNLYQELKAFFTEPERLLPGDLFSRNGLNLGVHAKPGFIQLPKYVGGKRVGTGGNPKPRDPDAKGDDEAPLFTLGVDQLLVPVVNFLKKPDLGKLLEVIPLEVRNGAVGTDNPATIGPFSIQAAWLFATRRELDQLAQSRAPNAFLNHLYGDGEAQGSQFVQMLRNVASAAADGRPHDGAIIYLAGALNLPAARSGVRGFMGLLADRDAGVLTQFQFTGNASDLVVLDVGGRLAMARRAPGADGKPSVDLSLAGKALLTVLGHDVIDARLALEDGVFTFADKLSLFPASSAFQANAQVKGRISRDALSIVGTADVALPPLPPGKAALDINYQRALLSLSWLGQTWDLSVARQAAAQYLLSASAQQPVTLLPGLVTLTDADNEAIGPALALAGPVSPSVILTGRVRVPRLGASGGGKVIINQDQVSAAFDTQLFGRHRAGVWLKGGSLDRPGSFTFEATLQGDLLGDLARSMHAGIGAMLEDAQKGLDAAKRLFDEEWGKFTRLVAEGYDAVRAGVLQAKQNLEKLLGDIDQQVSKIIGLLQVNDQELQTRKLVLQQLNDKAREGLQWFIDRVAETERILAAKRAEIAGLENWYFHQLRNDWERFWNWGYFSANRARLWLEAEALPVVLDVARQELEKAKQGVQIIHDGVDGVLQQLDRIRNGLHDELERQKRAMVERKGELDRYNGLLLKSADELLREFGKTVDSTAKDAAQKAFEAASTIVQGFKQANEYASRHNPLGLPFELERLSVSGALGGGEAMRFEARADIWFNLFETRKLATDFCFTVDFNDLSKTATELARELWQKRDQLQFNDWEALRRQRMAALDAQFTEVSALRARLGPAFGEPLEKKLLYDMNWKELLRFYDWAKAQALERFPVLADVIAVVEQYVGDIFRAYQTAMKNQSPWAQFVRAKAEEVFARMEQRFKQAYLAADMDVRRINMRTLMAS